MLENVHSVCYFEHAVLLDGEEGKIIFFFRFLFSLNIEEASGRTYHFITQGDV